MNLGQLIDPEWAQQGHKERLPVQRRSPLLPMGTVTHANGMNVDAAPKPAETLNLPRPLFVAKTKPAPVQTFEPARERRARFARGFTLEILRVLAAVSDGAPALSIQEVHARLGRKAPANYNNTGALLSVMAKRGMIAREGKPREYRHRISALGRTRIPPA